MDQGIEVVEKFLNQVMIPKVEVGDYERVKDYKTALQEKLQVKGSVQISYRVVKEEGPAHDKRFEVIVSADGQDLSQGQGKSKKLAEQAAAKAALDQLG